MTPPRKVQIGDSVTLYCGDARVILPRLPDASVDFVFTDPPYGHNNNNNDLIARREVALSLPTKNGLAAKPRPIANDGPEANDLFRFFASQAARLLRRCCCCCCCCCGGGPDPQFARWSLWLDEVMEFKQQVVWDKGPMGMGWHYRRSYETVLVAQKGKGRCNWYDTTRRVENVIRPGSGIRKIIPRADQHPTEKPVALPTHFIGLHSLPGDLVLDPFLGHGTTAVACVQTGRRCIGVELDPGYFEIAVRRVREAVKAKRSEPQRAAA
jgi:site-specific DNA-methyltransferase (adenine-specific)